MLSTANSGALIAGTSIKEKENVMQKLTIKVIRAFFRNGEVQKVGTVLRDIPAVEAMNYVNTGKAAVLNAADVADPAAKTFKDKEK